MTDMAQCAMEYFEVDGKFLKREEEDQMPFRRSCMFQPRQVVDHWNAERSVIHRVTVDLNLGHLIMRSDSCNRCGKYEVRYRAAEGYEVQFLLWLANAPYAPEPGSEPG